MSRSHVLTAALCMAVVFLGSTGQALPGQVRCDDDGLPYGQTSPQLAGPGFTPAGYPGYVLPYQYQGFPLGLVPPPVGGFPPRVAAGNGGLRSLAIVDELKGKLEEKTKGIEGKKEEIKKEEIKKEEIKEEAHKEEETKKDECNDVDVIVVIEAPSKPEEPPRIEPERQPYSQYHPHSYENESYPSRPHGHPGRFGGHGHQSCK